MYLFYKALKETSNHIPHHLIGFKIHTQTNKQAFTLQTVNGGDNLSLIFY
jgi:hypothetical protein